MTISLSAIFYKGLMFFAAIGAAFLITKLIGKFLPKESDKDENELSQ